MSLEEVPFKFVGPVEVEVEVVIWGWGPGWGCRCDCDRGQDEWYWMVGGWDEGRWNREGKWEWQVRRDTRITSTASNLLCIVPWRGLSFKVD